jgi:MFS family permease
MLPVRRRAIRAAAVSIIPEPFRIPAFRAFWLARLVSTIAQMAMIIVIGWQVYDLARETMGLKAAALMLGLIGLVQFAPLFILTLVTGWTADRVDRRWVARAAVALELACALALGWYAWRGTTTFAALYTVAALLGVARAFAGPALGALAPNLVPRKILPHAIALSSIAWQSGAIAGPAIGGYLYAWAPVAPYAASAILFSIALIGLMAIGPVKRAETMATRNPWAQMVEGLRYVRHNRLVLGAISLDLFAVLLGGATAMLPVFARDVLHAGPEGLGHLRAAPAVGATLTAAFFAVRPLKTNVGVKMLFAVAVFGTATIVFGFSRSMPLSLACLALLGAADMFSVYVRQSLIQLYTPDSMRGRVGAVSSLFISASNELGEAESGFLGAIIGPVAAVIAGGVGAIGVVLLWAWWFPELRLARSFDQPDVPASGAKESNT